MNEPQKSSRRRTAFVAGVSLASAAAAGLLFLMGFRRVFYDAFQYFMLSRVVSEHGLWNFADGVRTYGYPLFVAATTGFASLSPEASRVPVFAAQLAIHLGVALFAARITERTFGSPRFFYGTFALIAANPFALIHATELLTDSLSASLLALAFFSSIAPGRTARRALLSFLWGGFAVAVRPANAAVLLALAVVWALRARLYREQLRRAVLPAAAAVAIGLLPQLYTNVHAFGKWTPLPTERLYGKQVGWGMAILKYGTLVVPDQPPQLVYRNPFYPPGAASPGEFFARRPLGYLATLGLHGFALFDQDLPFTYVENPRPAYRWPLSLVNYAYLFLSLSGLMIGLARSRAAAPAVRLYFRGAAVATSAYVAVYVPVAVEARFSLPVYLWLAPACVFAVEWLRARHSGTAVAMAVAGGGFIAVCVQISLWMTRQAPALSSVLGR